MEMDEKRYQEFEETLEELVGETCTEIISATEAFPDTPEYVNKAYLAYTIPETNILRYVPLIGLRFGLYEPHSNKNTYTLGFIGTWHILKNAKSVCAYVGAYNRDGKLLENLKILENQTVKRVVFIREKLNLFIEFDNQRWIGIFHSKNHISGFSFGEYRGHASTDWFIINEKITWVWGMSR